MDLILLLLAVADGIYNKRSATCIQNPKRNCNHAFQSSSHINKYTPADSCYDVLCFNALFIYKHHMKYQKWYKLK